MVWAGTVGCGLGPSTVWNSPAVGTVQDWDRNTIVWDRNTDWAGTGFSQILENYYQDMESVLLWN